MKSFVSQLKEKVILLEHNKDTSKTTMERYREVLHTRGFVRILKSDDTSEVYEIIIPKPPVGLKLQITGVKWKEKEYSSNSIFTEYKDKFLKGTIVRYLN